MNQINLENLLVQAQSNKSDAAGLKLLVAQVYQAQVQQLTQGDLRLQLPQPGGALQLNLPENIRQPLQLLLSQATTTPNSNIARPVLLQFQPLADGRIELTLQNPAATIAVPVSSVALRQVLQASLQQVLSAQSIATNNGSSAMAIAAVLTKQPAGFSLQIDNLPAIMLRSAEQPQLSALLGGKNSTTVQLLLQLPAGADKPGQTHTPSWALSIAPQAASTFTPQILTPANQHNIMQQLVGLINQQQLPAQPMLPQLHLAAKTAATVSNHHIQLNWPATANTAPQLQLISSKAAIQLIVEPQQFNRPIQLSLPASAQTTDSTDTTVFPRPIVQHAAAQQVALQHAWRQLLPLLPAAPSTLASLTELPEPIQHIFQLIRRSQPDGNTVLTAAQIQPQLSAALAFQPLQTNPQLATGSGTLAVAIQLLLGHLLQKPAAPAQPAQAMARLISQLEPAQASTALRQLAGHSSTLQQSQLATLESSNNQQLILQLPLQQGAQSQFCQLMLEQREADGKQLGEKRQLWQLTMRFDLQQYGAMMVVAKLAEQQLKLQFYTEQPAAKQQTERFLPILKDRCTMQGIQVEHAECVLGKIPDTLVPRANSLLAIKA